MNYVFHPVTYNLNHINHNKLIGIVLSKPKLQNMTSLELETLVQILAIQRLIHILALNFMNKDLFCDYP